MHSSNSFRTSTSRRSFRLSYSESQVNVSSNAGGSLTSSYSFISGTRPSVESSRSANLPSDTVTFRNLLPLPSMSQHYRTDATPISPSQLRPGSVRNSPAYLSLPLHSGQNEVAGAASTANFKVVKTRKYYDLNTALPTYSTHGGNRGEVLIINNIMFKDNKHYREGAKEDDKRLKTLFKDMGFRVDVHKNLTTSSMASKIRDFSRKSSLRTADIAVVVIMSHGTENKSIGDTEVFGVDEKTLALEDILENFTDSNCKNMQNKPKIFILQCCRGDNEQFIQSDARLTPKSATRDVLIAYSTLPGFVSYRDPSNGTWYIQNLCEVFSRHAHVYHVEDLLKLVDNKISEISTEMRQTTSYESRGFKRCYLHPK